MNRVAEARPTGLGRKAFWVAVAAIVAMMLAWASAVLSYPYGDADPYYEYGDGGMPRPDGIIVQHGPPPGMAPGGHGPSTGITYTYNATTRPDGSILITRNGAKWVVLANKKHQFLLSDPNGTGHTVVKMFGFPTGGRSTPVRLRDPAR